MRTFNMGIGLILRRSAEKVKKAKAVLNRANERIASSGELRAGSERSVTTEMKRLGILLSGRGSNFMAIAEAIRAGRLPGSGDRRRSVEPTGGGWPDHRAGDGPAGNLRSFKRRTRAEHDAELIARLHQHRVDLVCLLVICGSSRRSLCRRFRTAF